MGEETRDLRTVRPPTIGQWKGGGRSILIPLSLPLCPFIPFGQWLCAVYLGWPVPTDVVFVMGVKAAYSISMKGFNRDKVQVGCKEPSFPTFFDSIENQRFFLGQRKKRTLLLSLSLSDGDEVRLRVSVSLSFWLLHRAKGEAFSSSFAPKREPNKRRRDAWTTHSSLTDPSLCPLKMNPLPFLSPWGGGTEQTFLFFFIGSKVFCEQTMSGRAHLCLSVLLLDVFVQPVVLVKKRQSTNAGARVCLCVCVCANKKNKRRKKGTMVHALLSREKGGFSWSDRGV